MKTLSIISATALLAAMFAIPAWADSVDAGKPTSAAQASYGQTRVDPNLIAQLQEASDQAVREGRNGNKNNPVFGQKSAQIKDLIERLKSGQKVDPADIDQAFEPARVW